MQLAGGHVSVPCVSYIEAAFHDPAVHADPVVSAADDLSLIVTGARAPQLCKGLHSDLNLSVAGSQMHIAAPGEDKGWVAPQTDAAPARATSEHLPEQSRRGRDRPGTAKAKKAAAQRQVGGVLLHRRCTIERCCQSRVMLVEGVSNWRVPASDAESILAAANQ